MIHYTNRKGQVYYLHQGQTNTGRPKYYFAKKEPDAPITAIPDGYEIYENPNGQVFLRQVQPKVISNNEVASVQQGMIDFAQVRHYLIDVKKNIITIHTASQDPDDLLAIFGDLPIANRQRVQETLTRNLNYMPMMRFILTDKQTRQFVTERYCFRGAIDDWIQISSPGSLEKLVRHFVRHLDQDSFYELFYSVI